MIAATALPRNRNAFTMVELMVVMLILTVLAAMVVGLGHYVAQKQSRDLTKTQQRIIMTAAQEYFSTYNTMPEVSANGPYACSLQDLSAEENAIYGRINELYAKLDTVAACQKILQELPAGSITRGHLSHPGAFVDAYGKYMDYQPSGGMGGAPVLISGGPDGYIGGDYEADDIRSE
jgi:prepilin-type N-terminal cleavage/methylation domain-containing protein